MVPLMQSRPFSFEYRRDRIDWRKLHAVDVDRMVREADIETLESLLDTVTFGYLACNREPCC